MGKTKEEILNSKTHHTYYTEGINNRNVCMDGVDYNDALDAMDEWADQRVASLTQENEALRHASGWIPVSELPITVDNGFMRCLVYNDNDFSFDDRSFVFVAKYNPVTKNFLNEKFNIIKITHWQPLPNPLTK